MGKKTDNKVVQKKAVAVLTLNAKKKAANSKSLSSSKGTTKCETKTTTTNTKPTAAISKISTKPNTSSKLKSKGGLKIVQKQLPAKRIMAEKNTTNALMKSANFFNRKKGVGGGGGGEPSGSKPSTLTDKSIVNIVKDIRVNGFSSFCNAVEKATPKVKPLLMNECDLIMECRYCRNLFRSLANFISHKLNYCKALFHPATENGCAQLIQQSSNPSQEIRYQYHIDTSSALVEQKQSNPNSNQMQSESKSGVIEGQQAISSLSLYNQIHELNEGNINEESVETVKLILHPLKDRTDSVVFQSNADKSLCDPPNQPFDNRGFFDRDTAILGPDGKVICTGTEKGIEKIVRHLTVQIDLAQRKLEQNSTNQFMEKCYVCKTVFTSEKALRQHRRDAPDCVQVGSVRNFPAGVVTSESSVPPLKRTKMENASSVLTKQLFSKSSLKSPSILKTPLAYRNEDYNNSAHISTSLNKREGPSSSSEYSALQHPFRVCHEKYDTTADLVMYREMNCAPRGVGVGSFMDRLNDRPRIQIAVRNYYEDPKKYPGSQDSSSCILLPPIKMSKVSVDKEYRKPFGVDLNLDVNSNVPILSNSKIINNEAKKHPDQTVHQDNGSNSLLEFDKHPNKSRELGSSSVSDSSESGSVESELTGKDSSISSCSEKDETASNITDSGLSSSGGVVDDMILGAGPPISILVKDNETSCSELEELKPDVQQQRPRSKRKQKQEDRILTPKNKNMKEPASSTFDISLVQSQKRISIRNLEKTSLNQVVGNEGIQKNKKQ